MLIESCVFSGPAAPLRLDNRTNVSADRATNMTPEPRVEYCIALPIVTTILGNDFFLKFFFASTLTVLRRSANDKNDFEYNSYH